MGIQGILRGKEYIFENCHANVEERGGDEYTPINLAAQNGHIDVVKYEGNTPLFNAAKYGHIEVVKYLCEHCHANANTKGLERRR